MKIIEVIADTSSAATISAIAEKHEAYDFRPGFVGEDGRQAMQLLVLDDRVQEVLDTLQGVLGAQPYAKILVVPLEVALPLPPEDERAKEDSASAAREKLYEEMEKSVLLNLNFLVLVVLSTIVAAIGLIESNVAVVIGAMVIAPLLGPNLALGFGTAIGDISLMRKSLKTNIAGIGLALAFSIAIGVFLPFDYTSNELISRTVVGLDSVALALASGAAAAMSLTTGLSSVLVGVMVAVALLPPAVAAGLMLGHGQFGLATGAALLFAVNMVCVNLATKVVFFVKGVRPRRWWEKEKARRAMRNYLFVWLMTLVILIIIMYVRRTLVE
ncbi:MAG: TIGR00341 family protein [Nitrospirae bacterium]|nr:TIGR00341 family protein [Nitrospirota bacterium]